MTTRPFATAFFLLCMFWLGSILITSDDRLRIERTCAPVSWVGKLTGSLMSLLSPDLEDDSRRSLQSTKEGCEYVVYRQFFAEEVDVRAERIHELEAAIAKREAELAAQAAKQKGVAQK